MMAEPLFEDERTRAAELFEQYAKPMAERLARQYRGVDPQRIADAVVESILWASLEWDVCRSDTTRKLAEHARQLLRTFLRGESRRRKREETHVQTEPFSVSLDDLEMVDRVKNHVAPSNFERGVLDLWLNGYTAPQEIGAALFCDTSEVTTALNRIRQRIHRYKGQVNRDE